MNISNNLKNLDAENQAKDREHYNSIYFSVLEFLQEYRKNPSDARFMQDNQDNFKYYIDLINLIDERIKSFESNPLKNLLQIKTMLDTYPLNNISFKDDAEKNLDPIQYLSEKKLDGKKLYFTAPAHMLNHLSFAFIEKIKPFFSIIEQSIIIFSRRAKIAQYSKFFPIALIASTLLSIFSLVPATILNPINLIIVVAAYIVGSYLMFLPEHIKKEDKNHDHRLYHFGILNICMAIASVVLYIFLPLQALMFLFSLTPFFANEYKTALIYENTPRTHQPVPKKVEFLNEAIKGCSLFATKDDPNQLLFNDDDIIRNEINT